MDNFINLKLLSHPLNWGVVWIVLLLTAFALTVICHSTGSDCACNDTQTD